MAEALSTTANFVLSAQLTNAKALSTPTDALAYGLALALTTGTGAGQADRIWSDTRTLTASTSESLDLYGSLTDGLGQTLNLARVKGVLIYNKASTAGDNLFVGGAASNAWGTWTSVSGSKITVGPGGVLFLYNPSATAYAVTATTADILKIDNQSSDSITYDIVVIGASA